MSVDYVNTDSSRDLYDTVLVVVVDDDENGDGISNNNEKED